MFGARLRRHDWGTLIWRMGGSQSGRLSGSYSDGEQARTKMHREQEAADPREDGLQTADPASPDSLQLRVSYIEM